MIHIKKKNPLLPCPLSSPLQVWNRSTWVGTMDLEASWSSLLRTMEAGGAEG